VTVPPSLFKYEAFSTQALHNLKSQVIYFGSPLKFNDPYDCALTPNLQPLTDAEVEAVRKYYLSRPEIPARARAEFESHAPERLRESFMRAGREAFAKVVNDFLAAKGVACFSERNEDLLMWSHYGGQYKGFCLEFDTSHEPFSRIYPVKYVSAFPPLSVARVLMDREYNHILELFCTKSSAWAYEREWRAIHKVAGTAFVYEASALKGVYFGPDIARQSLEIICLILGGQNDKVQFWQGRRSSTEFRVLFEPFTYTSHIEARRKGLL
jgi:hypothetical protein